MIPDDMLNLARDDQKLQYFELIVLKDSSQVWCLKQREDRDPVIPSTCPLQSLSDAIGPEAAKKKRESTYPTGNTPENYQLFIDLISKMLSLRPDQRLKAQEALNHPFIADSQPGGLLLSGADSSQSSSTDDVKK
jgi:serine/threonine protein kinase